jgi:DNA-binding winged helix-turn-helix (wHTH) protein
MRLSGSLEEAIKALRRSLGKIGEKLRPVDAIVGESHLRVEPNI